jgi:hypothetical protein
MKTLRLLCLCLLMAAPASAQYPHVVQPLDSALISAAALTTIRMVADTEKIAMKFYARTTSPITHADMYLDVNGDVTGITFTLEIQTDSSDAPSGTPVGTATAAFAGPAADGFVGEKALASNTGALTVNTPYWLVLARSGGGSLSGSVWVQAFRSINGQVNLDRIRHHNGTNWTTTTALSVMGLYVVKHSSGAYTGSPITVSGAASASTDIFGTNRQGLKLKFGSRQTLHGVRLRFTKTGSPSSLTVKVYEGTTERQSQVITAAEITTAADFLCWFTTPYEVSADANVYIIVQQTADGGDDSNDYDLRTATIHSAYIAAFAPTDWRFVSGTGDDPTALTVSTTQFPQVFPIVTDPAADFEERAKRRIIGG